MFYVAYRDPQSLLNDHWKLMGSAPTEAFSTLEEANAAARRLVNAMHYDVMVVQGAGFRSYQDNSRSRY